MAKKPPIPDNVIPFLRITVIGDADSGKTSLINAWLNNAVSINYTPTLDPTLYYRTMKIPNPLNEDEMVTALVELEDTYAPIRTGGVDIYGQKQDINELLEVKPPPAEPVVTPQYFGPFAEYEALTELKYEPLTRCRMGFLLIFDATVEESLKTAMEMFTNICLQSASKTTLPKGITLFLVANKIDKDPLGEQTKRNLGAARAFSELKEIPYFEVSALQFLRVHKVFREMVENIILQPQLWSSDSLKEFYQKHRQQTILQDQCVLS